MNGKRKEEIKMIRKLRRTNGFTLAELLMVIGIISIIAGISFIAVSRYMRSLAKLEFDGNAKSIFVAAQNHLTMASHEGFLGRSDFGEEESEILSSDPSEGVYDFIESPSGFPELDNNDSNSVLGLVLPFGSIDDSIRSGSYLIRYHKDSAQILDVFYWAENGWNGRYPYTYQSSDYADLLEKGRSGEKSSLQDYNGSVVGYYGGADAESLTKGTTIKRPEITVRNAEKLSVKIKNTNKDNEKAKLRLYIKGHSSGNVRYIDVRSSSLDANEEEYEIILDDITTAGKHFFEQFCDTGNQILIPGEDISVYAVAYNDEEYTNIAYSSEQTTNSLFASIEGEASTEPGAAFKKIYTTANISNIRHMENLDNNISGVNNENSTTNYTFWIGDNADGTYALISEAKQISNLDWNGFTTIISEAYDQEPHIYNLFGNVISKKNCFLPLNPDYPLTYHGNNTTIKNITVDTDNNGGLFGAPSEALTISDVKLVDFRIKGLISSGALAGTLTDSEATNVLAINSKNADDEFSSEEPNISSISESAGGLIGSMSNTTVSKCAAALYVNGNTDAGGLIGTMSHGTVSGSYAGGHTNNGIYDDENINISATGNAASCAGGLIGSGDGTITSCYSTCSVSGGNAGGFIGSGRSSTSLSNCYCTGLVDGTVSGAFAASLAGTQNACYYFGIINPIDMAAVGTSDNDIIKPFDENTSSYRAFLQIDEPAKAVCYDAALIGFYQGDYHLKPIEYLGSITVEDSDCVKTHYGDWPAPDLFFVNERA